MTTATRAVGAGVRRIEGAAKVTGQAQYAMDFPLDDVAYVWPVQATIAAGEVRTVHAEEIAALPGVLAVLDHRSAPRLQPAKDPELTVLQDPHVSYRSLEAAREGAGRLRVDYDEHPHDSLLTADHADLYAPETVNAGHAGESVLGDVDAAIVGATYVVDVTYTTPAEHNNPMEPHSAAAVWDGRSLTVYDSDQGPQPVRDALATLFGLEPADVHVIAEHVGGGFGSKGTPRPNVVLAALAAKATGRAVRLALPRHAMFSLVGYRTPTIQHLRLGADSDGRLVAIEHDAIPQSSTLTEFTEQTAATRIMYAAPNRAPPTGSPGSRSRRRRGCALPVRPRGCTGWSRRWTSWPSRAGWTRSRCAYATSPTVTRRRTRRSPAGTWWNACARGRNGSAGPAATHAPAYGATAARWSAPAWRPRPIRCWSRRPAHGPLPSRTASSSWRSRPPTSGPGRGRRSPRPRPTHCTRTWPS